MYGPDGDLWKSKRMMGSPDGVKRFWRDMQGQCCAVWRKWRIRESCGKAFGIAIDFLGRVHKPMAKVLAKKLEEFDLMFLEEPVLCENMEAFAEIAAACNIPITTGERLYSRWDFKRLLHAVGVDIIQLDLSHAGGITEVKKIASMAEAYDVALAPHCPLGPIALAASGLGVEVNKELVEEENRTPHNWKNPVWRHADGSIAEWQDSRE